MVEFLKGFLIYVIIWWIVVFTILPIGIRKPDIFLDAMTEMNKKAKADGPTKIST